MQIGKADMRKILSKTENSSRLGEVHERKVDSEIRSR
jgi:hypothetical protein